MRLVRRAAVRFCVPVSALCGVLLGFSCGDVQAFKPEYEAHGHTMIARTTLGLGGYRFGATEFPSLAIARFSYLDAAGTRRFVSKMAIEAIILGVQSRDHLPIDPNFKTYSCDVASAVYFAGVNVNMPGRLHTVDTEYGAVRACVTADLGDLAGHFDSDNFVGSARQIRALFVRAHALMRIWDGEQDKSSSVSRQTLAAARLTLGKAIHTIQDFYAHSTWANFRTDDEIWTGLNDFMTSSSADVSLLRLDQLARAEPAKSELTTTSEGGNLSGSFCNSRSILAAASGLTPEENEGNYEVVPRTGVSSAAWWESTEAIAVNLVSGLLYHAPASDEFARSRCDHGVAAKALFENAYYSGIAKDMPGWPLSPGAAGRVTGRDGPIEDDYSKEPATRAYPPWATTSEQQAAADATPLYLRASRQAALHTGAALDVLQAFFQQRALTAGEGERLADALFGGGGTFPQFGQAFVIDRSGSMADVLPGLVAAIETLLEDGMQFVLVDYLGDARAPSGVDVTVTTGSAADMRSRLSQLSGRGGDGCATPTWAAISAAVARTPSGATLTVITDASASDSALEPSVTAAAQAKGIKIVKLISGACSPLDPSYEAGSHNTGGSLVLLEHGIDDFAPILRASGALTTPRVVHTEAATLTGQKTVAFPVESGSARLSIAVHGSQIAMIVTRPSGAPLVGNLGVTVSQSLNGRIYSVDAPEQGVWQVSLSGAGEYAVSVYSSAVIDFDVLAKKSIIQIGRSGHEYRPQLDQPGQSGRLWLKAHVFGAQDPMTLDLLRLNGDVIRTVPLARTATDFFEGEVTLPTEAHRFRVRGFAADGSAFARVHGQGNVAPPVALPGRVVASMGAAGMWRAGTVNAFALNLKNLGGDDTVSFAPGTLPSGATLTCNPSSMVIPGSEQVNVLCSIYLPEAPDRADFSVVVSSATAVPAVAQTVTVLLTPLKLPLSCALDIDGDNRVDPAVDGVLLTRYLLGFRGAALTNGLTIPGPRKTDALLSAFFGNAAQFDLVGRASPAPTATVDGLLMTRLMLGYGDTVLLNGITIPAGAQFVTAAAIKDNVIAKCAGGF